MTNNESTFVVFSLAKIAYNSCNEIQQNWYNDLNVKQPDSAECCKSLFELIALNTKGGEFDPCGDKRSIFNKVAELNIVKNIDNVEWRKIYEVVYTQAMDNEHFDCFKMAHEIGIPWDVNATIYAAKKGQLRYLIYLHENGCPWDESACSAAAENGHLDCLTYAHNNSCPWSATALILAAYVGQLDILVYLLENGCPKASSAGIMAAKNGHIECLMYLHRSGVGWSRFTSLTAASNGHIDCLRYAIRNGCEFDRLWCIEAALQRNFNDCAEFLMNPN